MEGGLVGMCLDAATRDRQCVDVWRRQKRTLERMPNPLGEAILNRLIKRRLLYPSLLEAFQHCVEEIDLRGERFVDAECMAYLGGFRYLQAINLSDCKNITNAALWSITGMSSLTTLDLSRCSKVTDAGVEHLLSLPNLKKLSISETGVGTDGVTRLSCLQKLTFLDLGGLPVTDAVLSSLQGLKLLEHLDLWGSKISNEGVSVLESFSKLSFLNIAWTQVTVLPFLGNLKSLNMSNCTIDSLFRNFREAKVPLSSLVLSGATFTDLHEAFCSLDMDHLSVLNISCSSVDTFGFLNRMNSLQHLNLSSTNVSDDAIDLVALIGHNLRVLDLSHTRITSSGVASLVGSVANLETLSLSNTLVDNGVLCYLAMMPALMDLNLSNTKITGIVCQVNPTVDAFFSLTVLQNLDHLERLDLELTDVRDLALVPLSTLKSLTHLLLKSDFLSDVSLNSLSSISSLKFLGLQNAVLTDTGINTFIPPPSLTTLDVRGCWLLTEKGILKFHQTHPQIRVRHEAVEKLFEGEEIPGSNQHRGSVGSPKNLPRRTRPVPLRSKNEKQNIRDERKKYSRSELLQLQSPCLANPSVLVDADITLPDELRDL